MKKEKKNERPTKQQRRAEMKASVCEKTIQFGRNRYRVSVDGSWQVMAFGSFIGDDISKGLRWKWISIPENSVPESVRGLA